MKKYFAYLLCVIIMSGSVYSCSKKNDEPTPNNDKKTGIDSPGVKTNKKTTDRAVSDTAYFGMCKGKYIIIDDYYKYSANENLSYDTTGSGYDTYSGDFKSLLQKLGVYDEKKVEYSFDEFKPEFAAYTNFRKGDNIYVSSKSGVYPAEVSGFYINLDDMIGAGTVFYSTVNAPKGAKYEDNEIVVCSFNNNMGAINRKGVTNQQMIDQFKVYIMPKLKGVMVSEYDDKGQPKNKPLTKIANEDIKMFEGNFTGKGNNEFLVSVKLQNDFTNFTSLIYVMDSEGKVISEFIPLAMNNFTFSMAEGVTDINGDGVLEIITYDGYYEGGGYNLNKNNGGLFKLLTTGFVFGV